MKVQFSLICCLAMFFLISCGNSTKSANENPDTSISASLIDESIPVAEYGGVYETLNGWLGKGIPEKTIIDSLGIPEYKGEEAFWEGTATYVQRWEYRGLGLALEMEAYKQGEEKKVFHIEVTSPSAFTTSKGVAIDSTKEEVLESYAGEINEEESESGVIVVGSIYGGTCFFIKDGKVSKIFIGELAE